MSAEKPLKLWSKVQVEVIITLDARSNWGTETTVSQVHNQAVRETLNAVGLELTKLGWRHSFSEAKAKVITFVEPEK